MASMNLIVLLFLQASLNCLLVAGVVWALLCVALRFWPGLALQRSVWLLAQGAVLSAFLLVCLPHGSVLPALELGAPATTVASGLPAQINASGTQIEAAGDAGDGAWLAQLAWAWAALYGIGLMFALVQWNRARRHMSALLAGALPLGPDQLRAHPALGTEQLRQLARFGMRVAETSAPVSPMLLGLRRPCLLLPHHLRGFGTVQQQLIIAHELTHWRRNDPLLRHLSVLLQTLLWFNPALRAFDGKLGWAQELGCDQQVLAGQPPQHRQQYAAALVAQLKLQQTLFAPQFAPLAFGAGTSVGVRIKSIRDGAAAPVDRLARTAVVASLSAVLGASVVLQPALAWRADAAPATPDSVAETATAQWNSPIAVARVSSFYGARRDRLAAGHHGVDFAARTGTPVLATADATVLTSTDQYEGGSKYGHVIILQHANGLRSLYAHLDSRAVRVGDIVKGGQQIGSSGASGKVTGPHLHLEVWKDEQRIDPQHLLAGLDEYAFVSALRERASRQDK